jgi:type IV pilus assembly protein PilV
MNQQSGFTLVEVLIATLIFSIGLLAVASMQVMSIRGNNHSAALTEASYYALGQMERLMSLPHTDGDLAAGNHPDSPLNEGIYSISWNVSDDVATNNTKTIDVTVVWTERGAAKTYEIQGIKAR